ncbi:hypothetical protein [Schleiferilactobacillus shenzhenensis]|nr:hypothetical protein [Schleiferilactobacillus shenzhenensis]
MRRSLIVFLAGLFVLLAAGGYWLFYGQPAAAAQTPAGRTTALVLRRNLRAVNAGSVADYLATIVPAQRAETRPVIQQTLTKRQATVKLQDFAVQKQSAAHLTARVNELQTERRSGRRQVLEATVDFTRQGGRWYIARLVVVNAANAG